ncbi:MAG TPA: cation:proton antiporter, partial [Pantanalinema sp.]
MTLLYLGLLVLLGFACARLFRRLGLPAVTGYLLVGVAVGPSALHLVGEPTLGALKPLSAFCLATIFFLLGEEFKLQELRKLGPRFLSITLVQCLLTFVLVSGLLVLARAPLEIALLMGAIAGTTDPAATLGVIRELRAKGELVKTLLAVIALNSLVEMVLFNLLLPVVEVVHRGSAAFAWQEALLSPLRELGGSALLGVLLALGLRAWSLTPYGRDSLKLPTIGLILLGAGACEGLHLSVLLTMLVFGATVANAVPVKVQVFDLVKAMEGPLLIMFFTLSGASLHLSELATMGWIGVAYVGGRLAGKLFGGAIGATIAGADPACRRYLGCGLVPQASMAIGLAFIVQEKFPDMAGPILPVALGAVVVFEAIGPAMTRLAILRSGEDPASARAAASPLPVPRLA